MIPKSGYRFSEKIMLHQQAKAGWKIIPLCAYFLTAIKPLRQDEATIVCSHIGRHNFAR
jgi:hypothetical protein